MNIKSYFQSTERLQFPNYSDISRITYEVDTKYVRNNIKEKEFKIMFNFLDYSDISKLIWETKYAIDPVSHSQHRIGITTNLATLHMMEILGTTLNANEDRIQMNIMSILNDYISFFNIQRIHCLFNLTLMEDPQHQIWFIILDYLSDIYASFLLDDILDDDMYHNSCRDQYKKLLCDPKVNEDYKIFEPGKVMTSSKRILQQFMVQQSVQEETMNWNRNEYGSTNYCKTEDINYENAFLKSLVKAMKRN